MGNTLKKRILIPFVVFTATIMLLGCILENINGRFWLYDFKVYYEASHAMLNGGQVYGVAFALGSGYYKYSPFTGLLFAPLSLLPYKAACLIQYSILVFATIKVLITVYRITSEYLFDSKLKSISLFLSVVFICFIIHLVRELHLGNINLVLLLLLALSLHCTLHKRYLLAGFLLALVIITKPFFVLLLMPLVLHKYFKVILSLSGSLIIFVLLPIIVFGFSKNLELHKAWLETMVGHADAFPSNNTLDAIINRYAFNSMHNSMQYVILFCISIAYLVLFYFVKRERTEEVLKKDFIIEWFLFIALMPTIFRTDTQHFLLSVPLILVICFYLFTSRDIWAIILFVISILMYDINSTDLLGKNLSAHVNEMGLLGISNIIIVTMALVIYFKDIRIKRNV